MRVPARPLGPYAVLWRLAVTAGFLVSGSALLVHEQNAWLFQRSAFLHPLMGWTIVVAAVFPFARAVRPRSQVAATGFALTFVVQRLVIPWHRRG